MENKSQKIIIIVSVIVVLLTIIGVFYFTSPSKNKVKEKARNYTLELKHDSYGNICNQENCSEDYKEKYVLNTITKDAKYLNIDNNKRFILLEDDGLKIYDLYKESYSKVNFDDYKKYTDFYLYSDLDKVYGIEFAIFKDFNSEENSYMVYDLEKEKTIYEGKDQLLMRSPNYGEKLDDERAYLIDVNTNKTILSDGFEDGVRASYDVYEDKGNTYIHEYCASDAPCSTLYTKDGKEIIDLIEKKSKFTIYNGNLYVASTNEIFKYDANGKLLETIKDYKNIIGINNKYILVVDNNKVNMIDFINKDKHELSSWNKETYLGSWEYYPKNTFNVKEIQAGSYFEIYDNGNSECYYYNHLNNKAETSTCR